MAYYYINGEPSTMRETWQRWMDYCMNLDRDWEWSEECFALALYQSEAEDASMLPEECREHLFDCNIEITF
jgi:hypothetical protein